MWITRVSINNPVFAAMTMLALCVLGLVSYSRLGVEQIPDIALPVASVEVLYPGASPEAVEREVTRVIEDSANGVAGIRHLRSVSAEGRSLTTVEFSLDADMNRSLQDLRDRVAAVQAALPKDARAATVARYDTDNAEPVMVLALSAASRSLRELSMLADPTILKRLQRADGVARVEIHGLAARELRIDLDPVRLRAYGLTPAQVSQALHEANADQAVGVVNDATQDTLLRVEGRVRDPKAFAEVVIGRQGELPLTLADVGRVVERDREPDSLSRLNGQPAITFNVFRQQDANVVATGDRLKRVLEELRRSMPPGVELQLVQAGSDAIRDQLDGLRHTLVEGALLTVGIVFVFLRSWRSTVITGLTLPVSVLAAFIAMRACGFTLNFMTLMALSLCIGLLVDDAIVVRENIVRHLGMGKDAPAAAREGTDEIGLAVMATTFAICAVFVPVAFMGGVIGKLFLPFGISVVAAVLVSLFVSFTLDPMLSSVWPEPARERHLPGVGRLLDGVERAMQRLQDGYARLILWLFSRRRYRLPLPWFGRQRRWRLATIGPRGLVLAAGAASFVAALGLVPAVGSEFVPQTDQGFTQLVLRLPAGSSLERSDAKVRQVEAVVAGLPEVRFVSSSVGAGAAEGSGRAQAVLNIALVERGRRGRSQKQVEEALREALVRIPGIEVQVGFDRPIEVAVLGSDPAVLERVAGELAQRMQAIPGLVDLDLSVRPGVPTHAVRLKPGAIRELGLSGAQVAASLRAYVNGDAATSWTAPDGQQVEVLLRLPEAQRRNVQQMRQLPVAFAKDGTPIALEAVATLEPVVGPEVIRRQDTERREAVTAAVQGRSAGEVGDEVQRLVDATVMPPGVRFDVGGDTGQQQEAVAGVAVALLLAVVFIYIVLASQFGSLLQPLAIMASLPLSLIGVMLALLVTRSTVNVFSMIGFVMLMGLVTKNAILLVDFANRCRAAGASLDEALLQAGLVRLRPIAMTTAAMVFGMLPLALGWNQGGELQAPMGRAIIGGVLASTLLTLVVVPVLYSYLAAVREAGWRSVNPREPGGRRPTSVTDRS